MENNTLTELIWAWINNYIKILWNIIDYLSMPRHPSLWRYFSFRVRPKWCPLTWINYGSYSRPITLMNVLREMDCMLIVGRWWLQMDVLWLVTKRGARGSRAYGCGPWVLDHQYWCLHAILVYLLCSRYTSIACRHWLDIHQYGMKVLVYCRAFIYQCGM